MPIRWTQYFASVGAYQGELIDKEDVQKKFFTELDAVSEPEAGKSRFPELVILLGADLRGCYAGKRIILRLANRGVIRLKR